MPKYTFVCDRCQQVDQAYVLRSVMEISCEKCQSLMKRQLPSLVGSSDVSETVDSYTGIVHKEDQRQIVEHRRDEYYWTVEVPRFVHSGTYSTETMLEMGWIYVDDKGTVRIHDKPPHRR